MKIFNLFKITETYNRWKARTMEFRNDKVVIVIENLEIKFVTTPTGGTPNMEDFRKLMNESIKTMIAEVKAEYGF
jgi:hypothetical protein